MKRYFDDDQVTLYFVILDDGTNRQIRGWSDSKALVEAYLEFHSCKGMTMKSLTKPWCEMRKILEENINDEISIYHIQIKDLDKTKKHQDNMKIIAVPATSVELMFIRDEGNNFMYSSINYSFLNSAIPYLKNKYQRALAQIFLMDIIHKVIHNKSSALVESIQIDQLSLYLKCFPEQFG